MTKISMSFAERLRRSQDLYKILEGFEAYTPPREEESLTGFKNFTDLLSQSNQTVASKTQAYRNWVSDRRKTFFTGDKSVKMMFNSIRSAIVAQYGNVSNEKAQLDTIISTMRYSKVSKPPLENQTPESVRTYTFGKQSYATFTKNFNDVVTYISGLEKYQPGNEEFSLSNLNVILTNLNLLNNNVIQKYTELQDAKRERREIYDEFKDRVNRIRSYVRSKYGANSPEYGKIRSISY